MSTTEQVERELAVVDAARQALEDARAQFAHAIRTTHERVASVRLIAPAARLSPSRVHQLLSDG